MCRFICSPERFGRNIPTGITLDRYGRLGALERMARPSWAEAVKRLHEAKGLSQGDLAEKAGVRGNTLSDALAGKTSPRLETLEAIAAALEVPMWRLFVADRQADLLQRQEMTDAALHREADIAARVEQIVMSKMALLVKDTTKEVTSGIAHEKPKLAAGGKKR